MGFNLSEFLPVEERASADLLADSALACEAIHFIPSEPISLFGSGALACDIILHRPAENAGVAAANDDELKKPERVLLFVEPDDPAAAVAIATALFQTSEQLHGLLPVAMANEQLDGCDHALLANRKILLWLPGSFPVRRANRIATRLLPVKAEIHLVKPTRRFAKWKPGRELPRGATAEDVAKIIGTAEPIYPPGTTTPNFAAEQEEAEKAARFLCFDSDGEARAAGYNDGAGIYLKHITPGNRTRPPRIYYSKLCQPIHVLAYGRAGDGTAWGTLVEVTDPDDRRKPVFVDDESLAGTGHTWAKELASVGIRLQAVPHAFDLLHEYIVSGRPGRRSLIVSRLGLGEDNGRRFFVLRDGRILGNGGAYEALAPGIMRERDPGPSSEDTLADWQRRIAEPCIGNTRLILVVCASLGGALLRPLRSEGAIIHLAGMTSSGKTTALEAGLSAWGSGPAWKATWRSTLNAIETMAAGHSDMVLGLDEVQQCTADDLWSVAYVLANEMTRGRLSREAILRPSRDWRLITLSTGESTFADCLGLGRDKRARRGGQGARFLDIPLPASNFGLFEDCHGQPAHAFADALKASARHFYGTAGPAFVERLLTSYDESIAFAREEAALFLTNLPEHSSDEVVRVAKRFGIFTAAGELAIRLGILPWKAGTAADGIKSCFADWLQARGGNDPLDLMQGFLAVRRFVQANENGRFDHYMDGEMLGPSLTKMERVGFKVSRKERSGEKYPPPPRFLVYPASWPTLCAPYDAAAVAAYLRDKGLLVPGSKKITRVNRVPGNWEKRSRFYELTAEILGESEDGD